MTQISRLGYALLGIAVFIVDRITKLLALRFFDHEYSIFPGLSFQLVYNRGISWGIANTPNPRVFMCVTLLIIFVTFYLAWYTLNRARAGEQIYGEILILSGSISNILDRLLYGGVIDFILFYWKSYSFPIFNIADVAIVIGVGIMFLQLYKIERSKA